MGKFTKKKIKDFHYDATHVFMSILSILCIIIHVGLLIAAYFRARMGDDLYFTYAVAATVFLFIMGLVMTITISLFLESIKIKYDRKKNNFTASYANDYAKRFDASESYLFCGHVELNIPEMPSKKEKPKFVKIKDKLDLENTLSCLDTFSPNTKLSLFGIYLSITLFFLSLNAFTWSLFVSLYHQNRQFIFGYVYILVDFASGLVAPILFLSSITLSLILLSYYTENTLSIRNIIPKLFYFVKLDHRILRSHNPGTEFKENEDNKVPVHNHENSEKPKMEEIKKISKVDGEKPPNPQKAQYEPDIIQLAETTDETTTTENDTDKTTEIDTDKITEIDTDKTTEIDADKQDDISENELVPENANLIIEYEYWEVLDKLKWDLKENDDWYKWMEPHYSTWAFWIIICIASLVAFAQFIDATVVEEMVSPNCAENFDCFIARNSFNFEYFPCDSGNITDKISIGDDNIPVDFTLYCFRFKDFGFDSDVILAIGNAYALYLVQIAIFDKIVGKYYSTVHFGVDSFWTGTYLVAPSSAIVLVFRNVLFGNYQNLLYDVLRNWNIFNLLFYHVVIGTFIVTYRYQEQYKEIKNNKNK